MRFIKSGAISLNRDLIENGHLKNDLLNRTKKYFHICFLTGAGRTLAGPCQTPRRSPPENIKANADRTDITRIRPACAAFFFVFVKLFLLESNVKSPPEPTPEPRGSQWRASPLDHLAISMH